MLMYININMRTFISFLLGIVFVSCDPTYTFPLDYHISQENLTIIPEKDVYKVGDSVEIRIVVPHLVTYSNSGDLVPIEEVIGNLADRFSTEITKGESKRSNLYLNGKNIDRGKINFVYDDSSKSYVLEEKLVLEFLTSGNLFLRDCFQIIDAHFRVGNYANELRFSPAVGNRVLKIE